MILRACSLFLLCSALIFGGCARTKPYELELMPVPVLLEGKEIKANLEEELQAMPYTGVLFATDRSPHGNSSEWPFYSESRGHLLRLGLAEIDANIDVSEWREFFADSFSVERKQRYLLTVSSVRELGVLPESRAPMKLEDEAETSYDQPEEFFRLIQDRFDVDGKKEVLIYVHGYNTAMEDPVLMSAQFRHFLDYRGAYVAYSWPATSRATAYFKDLETTRYTGRNLRILIEALWKETDVEKINIMGYSAGTRVVIQAMHSLALLNQHRPEQERPRLGQVLLLASDEDRHVFLAAVADGLLAQLDQLTLYMSSKDGALRILGLFLSRNRLGQMGDPDKIREEDLARIRSLKKLTLVDVSGVPGSAASRGHAYLRKSPWVLADVVAVLAGGLWPEERSLKREEHEAVWSFPQNYPEVVLGKTHTESETHKKE